MRAFFAEASFETKSGEKLTLVCDFYTISVVEGIAGQHWNDIIPQLIDPPLSLFVQVLYGLLRKRHENITLDEVAALTYDVEDKRVLGVLMGAVIASACNFDSEEEEQDNPKKKQSGRSKTSARSG